MDSRAWRTILGDNAFDAIVNGDAPVRDGVIEEIVSGVLTRAVEAGFMVPTAQPQISPDRTKVLFPRPDGSVVPVLTAEGLYRHWETRGHGFPVLRTRQLMSAIRGPLYPWLQAIMIAYEERCTTDGVEPLPLDWRVFVGGKNESAGSNEICNALFEQSPKPDPSAIQRLFVPGDVHKQ